MTKNIRSQQEAHRKGNKLYLQMNILSLLSSENLDPMTLNSENPSNTNTLTQTSNTWTLRWDSLTKAKDIQNETGTPQVRKETRREFQPASLPKRNKTDTTAAEIQLNKSPKTETVE